MELAIATGGVCLALGLVLGGTLSYVTLYKPLLAKYHSLRLQGFVPQFELQQRRVHDPSEDIRER